MKALYCFNLLVVNYLIMYMHARLHVFLFYYNIKLMRTIYAKDIESKLEKIIFETGTSLSLDAQKAISKSLNIETSSKAKFAMSVLLENAKVAEEE
ncbi:MAG: hypothetical protein J6Y43_04530, partial [Clostridia bacterium]|nr:hypothetical protein [Clostridia bacterium]